MGSHTFRVTSDLLGLLGLFSLAVAIYFMNGLRVPFPWHADLYESVAWGRILNAAVYAGLSILFFWLVFRRVIPA